VRDAVDAAFKTLAERERAGAELDGRLATWGGKLAAETFSLHDQYDVIVHDDGDDYGEAVRKKLEEVAEDVAAEVGRAQAQAGGQRALEMLREPKRVQRVLQEAADHAFTRREAELSEAKASADVVAQLTETREIVRKHMERVAAAIAEKVR
jgi:hypothetical protein